MINFDGRLTSLKDRRQGTAERDRLEKSLFLNYGDYRGQESYERLQESSAIKYVIGAMAPVSAESTRISKEEGERVAGTLIDLLKTSGIYADRRMQGSVALDIHIEGHSDVDMLILKAGIVLVQNPTLPTTSYSDASDSRSMVDILRELRIQSEQKLTSRYHAAKVDIAGNKSISLSGGSLKRKVDIVPGCWYDSHDYQRTYEECFRGVKVYDKSKHELIENKPFLHIKKVNDRDLMYGGNLKKVARLMKNIIADMPQYKKDKAKKLTSYDIAGIAYAMDRDLACSKNLPLVLLENLRSKLLVLAYLDEPRNSLLVPDGTRKIFNSDEKVEALKILYAEVNDLAESIQRAIAPNQTTYDARILKNKHVVFF